MFFLLLAQSSMAEDSIPMALTDYSLTKRIVFLIDLDPLLHHQSPNSYLNCILSSAKLLLSFAPLSSSLFTFNLFFSSLSPILSSSKLRNLPLNLSFNDPHSTLQSLCETLESVNKLTFSGQVGPAQAANVATSMRQLLHDYSWDLFVDNDLPLGTPLMRHNLLKPNLVVMFSPICRTKKWVSEFMDSEMDEILFTAMDQFCSKFSSVFRSVSDAFLSKDIHFSWIDVNYAQENDNLKNEIDGSVKSGFFENAIRSLGWGFCSTQSIVSGSKLLSFGLIYPSIGISSKVFDFKTHGKRLRIHLALEISDANGKPLECKCCELELIDLKNLAPDIDSGLLLSAEPNYPHLEDHEKYPCLESLMDGLLKVEAVLKHDKFAKLGHIFSEPFIAREFTEKSSSASQSEFFASKVLELLASEMGEAVRKCPPSWQIFLGFMYREGYSALVSLTKGNGDKVLGILKPYTSTFALVSLEKQKSCSVNWLQNIEIRQEKTGDDPDGYVKKKKTRKSLVRLKNLTWSAFQKGKYEDLNIELEELYFAREADRSKKLLFIKYWMKQVKNTEYRLENLQVSEQPPSVSPSRSENSTTADLRVENEDAIDKVLENSHDVLGEIPNKIRLGVESEGVDLVALAERLVTSCNHCLVSESQSVSEKSDEGSGSKVITELIQLLLKDPKDLEEKNKAADQTQDSYTVREYELQILFRMEIMRLYKGSAKQRFVKQICSLLESIRCRLEAFFGDWNLHDYVEKTIKSRYCKDLEEVVHQIYSKMDLLFDDEDELPNLLVNSEENNDQRHDTKEGCNKRTSPRGKYMQRLTEAQDKRERARRFASLTTWQPDLQRVWAPKNAKVAVKVKLEQCRKTSKRRHRNDVVCETPMTQNKRSGRRANWSPDQGSGSQCSSVSKVLFSDTSNYMKDVSVCI